MKSVIFFYLLFYSQMVFLCFITVHLFSPEKSGKINFTTTSQM